MKDINLVLNSEIQIDELAKDDEIKGHHFVSKFIEAGIAFYDNLGWILITKETLDKFIQTMVGCPVIINHTDITPQNVEQERVGDVSRVWFEPADGWYYCEGIINDKQAIGLIKNEGWTVSCAYKFKTSGEPVMYHGKQVDMEFIDGDFQHLAIVKTPRYEGAEIVVNSQDVENGGEGSGDFDHAGRPPEVGGSEPARTGRKGKYRDGVQHWIGAKPGSKEDKDKEDKTEKKVNEMLDKADKIIGKTKRDELTLEQREKLDTLAEEYGVQRGNILDIREQKKEGWKSEPKQSAPAEKSGEGEDKLNITPKYADDLVKSGDKDKINQVLKAKKKEFDNAKTNDERDDINDEIYEINTSMNRYARQHGVTDMWEKTNDLLDYMHENKSNFEKEKQDNKNGSTNKQLRLFNSKERKITMEVLNELQNWIEKAVQNALGKDDKRAGIDKVAGIMKSAGCDDEDIRTAIGIMEKVAYDKSEAGTADNKCAKNAKEDDKKVCNEDKRKLIDEIGGILKGQKLDDEIIRTVIGKAEEIAYNPSETDKADNCGKAKNEKEEVKEEIKEDKKEVKNSLDDVSNILYKGNQTAPQSSYVTRAERLELGKKF